MGWHGHCVSPQACKGHATWGLGRRWSFVPPDVPPVYLPQYFELVVFTDEPNTYADPIISRLDTLKVRYRAVQQYSNTAGTDAVVA